MVVAWIRRWPLEGRLALMRRRCFAVRPIPPASDERMTAEGVVDVVAGTTWRYGAFSGDTANCLHQRFDFFRQWLLWN
jgi:hypothetical protein